MFFTKHTKIDRFPREVRDRDVASEK